MSERSETTATVVEIRPFNEGWQCFEAPGVQPYWVGDKAKEDASAYAKARMKFARGEIRVLDENRNVVETITNDDLKPIV